jgi:hypothetical protein
MTAYAPYFPSLRSVREANALGYSIADPQTTHSLLHNSLPLQYDRSGRSTGQATMEFASPQQAKVAINKFDGAMTKGAYGSAIQCHLYFLDRPGLSDSRARSRAYFQAKPSPSSSCRPLESPLPQLAALRRPASPFSPEFKVRQAGQRTTAQGQPGDEAVSTTAQGDRSGVRRQGARRGVGVDPPGVREEAREHLPRRRIWIRSLKALRPVGLQRTGRMSRWLRCAMLPIVIGLPTSSESACLQRKMAGYYLVLVQRCQMEED